MTPTIFIIQKIAELESDLRNFKSLLKNTDPVAYHSLGGSNPPPEKEDKPGQ